MQEEGRHAFQGERELMFVKGIEDARVECLCARGKGDGGVIPL